MTTPAEPRVESVMVEQHEHDAFRRVPQRAGWARPARLPRGPSGRALCRRCGAEVPRGRRTFCSDGCVHEWKIRTDPGYARRQVERRDAGVCAACGLDTVAADPMLRRVQLALGRLEPRRWLGAPEYRYQEDWPVRGSRTAVERAGRAVRSLLSSLWEADHIVPVAEGGGDCGLENLRTLCSWCHARASGELRRRLNARRREERSR